MSIVDSIIWSPLPEEQFVAEETTKEIIFLHHTASSPSPYGVLAWWTSNTERVGTSFVIAGKPQRNDSRYKDGDIVQAFGSRHWAWHLGLKASHLVQGGKSSEWLNKHSIGIEICNWGGLTLVNGKFITYMNTVVPETEVIEVSYRGYRYFQRYTDAQLEQTRKLMKYLGETRNIPLAYKGRSMFDVDRRCLMGERGVWTHTSCRPDKSDCFPQPELIQMLSSF